MKITYHQNKKEYGIIYDWKLIIKEYKKIVPREWWGNIDELPFNSADYFVENSERSIGKTTKWLLIGMVMNKLYGTHIQYIRQILDMIMPKNMKLFRTILDYGYIDKITNNQYNAVKYVSRSYYYYNTETEEIAPEPFCDCLSIDNNDKYVSSYNAPTGDLIIYDEFISRKYYHQNEFVDFEDLVKTIIRDRLSPIIVMLANTIDLYNEYYKELEIYDFVQSMRTGQSELITTDMGTKIYFTILSGKTTIEKKRHNLKYFGFKNPRLNSIRGGEWAIKSYPHIPKFYRGENTPQIIINNRYIRYNDILLNMEVVDNNGVIQVYIHDATEIYPDSIIYVANVPQNKNERYGFGYTKTDNFIWNLRNKNVFCYANNLVGEKVRNFIRIISQNEL